MIYLFAALGRFAFGHNKHLKAVAATYWKPQPNSLLNTLPSLTNISNPSSGYTNPGQFVQSGPTLSAQIGPVMRVGSDSMAAGRDGRVSTSSPLASTGILHGSPLSDDSSQHSDSGILLRESTSNGVIGYTRSKPLDNAIYLQCVLSMSALAKDPSARIASLGQKTLSIIGIEQVVTRAVKVGAINQHGDSSASSTLAGITRSSSWFDMNGGKLLLYFIICFHDLPEFSVQLV